MRLPHGSTSFNASGSRPDIKEFRRLCEAVARKFGASVEAFLLPDVTPNYATARIREREQRFDVLCHNALFLLAFADVSDSLGAMTRVFRDEPHWAEAFREWSSFRVMSVAELDRLLSTVDLSELNPFEHDQIRYWKPGTVGELTFNYWD